MSCEEAIILIPGGSHIKKQDMLIDFVEGLKESNINCIYKEIKVNECSAWKIESEGHLVDVYEAFWRDLMPQFSKKELKEKFLRSFYLLAYWTFSKIWASWSECPLLVFYFSLTVAIYVIWISLTDIVIFLAILNQTKEFFGEIKIDKNIMKLIGYAWITASIFITPFPVNKILDYANFVATYLNDKVIRNRIRHRISVVLNNVLSNKDYKRVTILTHSLGGVIATELLAESNINTEKLIRYVTVGTPLKFLGFKSQLINQIMEKCLKNLKTTSSAKNISWIDYSSAHDWLCTEIPLKEGIQSIKVTFRSSFLEQISGYNHGLYFSKKAVIPGLKKTIVSHIWNK